MNSDDLPIIPLLLSGDVVYYFGCDPACRNFAVVMTSEIRPRMMLLNSVWTFLLAFGFRSGAMTSYAFSSVTSSPESCKVTMPRRARIVAVCTLIISRMARSFIDLSPLAIKAKASCDSGAADKQSEVER